MADTGNSITAREAALRLLEWQVAFGADEALSDLPVDRLTPRKEEAPFPSPRLRGEGQGEGASYTAQPSPGRFTAGLSLKGEANESAAAEQTARALAEAATNLEELKAAIQSFTGSTLRDGTTNTVFADGNPEADLMLVGEAPGREEDLAGLPFVGRSGQLLDRMLAAIGHDRKAENPRTSAYITNVLPWRPPGNRTPTTADAAMLLPFVERHIVLVKPKLLVLLGGAAAKYLLGVETGILALRGKWRAYEPPGGGFELMAMPTLHPAYLLRQPAQKSLAWRDLLQVKKALIKGSA